MGRLGLSVMSVTGAGIATLLCFSVMSEDNTESTEQIVPAAQKVLETTVSLTEGIKPEILEYMGKEWHK